MGPQDRTTVLAARRVLVAPFLLLGVHFTTYNRGRNRALVSSSVAPNPRLYCGRVHDLRGRCVCVLCVGDAE
jgi:hypothetical protein